MRTVDGRGGVPICSATQGTNNGDTAVPGPVDNYTGIYTQLNWTLIMATLLYQALNTTILSTKNGNTAVRTQHFTQLNQAL